MILFLDFDGVLHSVGSSERQYFARLPLLERFLRDETPHWQVVISSSWREHFTPAQLRDLFSPDLRNRIIGSTPADSDHSLHKTWGAQASLYPREIQIRHYLAQRGLNGEDWMALDDIKGWFRDAEVNEHLVICNPEIGLSESDLVRLRNKSQQFLQHASRQIDRKYL